jgi:hypothetical protein
MTVVSRTFSIVMRLIAAAGLATTLAVPSKAHAGVVNGAKTVDDVMIYLGVVPAATVRGHSKTRDEAIMHGGAPTSEHTMHIVAAVFLTIRQERASPRLMFRRTLPSRAGCSGRWNWNRWSLRVPSPTAGARNSSTG